MKTLTLSGLPSASDTVAPSAPPANQAAAHQSPDNAFAWMDDTSQAVSKRVRASKALKQEQKRFKSMARQSVLGKARIWACDGEYVAVRLNTANPHTRERHNRFLAAGHYKHVETQDDVQVFELLEGSPFKRDTAMVLGDLSLTDVKRQAVLAAVRRDWVAYVDIIEEVAGRYKNMYDGGTAKLCFDETMQRMTLNIQMRGGPSMPEISAGIQSIRTKRGYESKRILLPARLK